jgi:hypothetical protein
LSDPVLGTEWDRPRDGATIGKRSDHGAGQIFGVPRNWVLGAYASSRIDLQDDILVREEGCCPVDCLHKHHAIRGYDWRAQQQVRVVTPNHGAPYCLYCRFCQPKRVDALGDRADDPEPSIGRASRTARSAKLAGSVTGSPEGTQCQSGGGYQVNLMREFVHDEDVSSRIKCESRDTTERRARCSTYLHSLHGSPHRYLSYEDRGWPKDGGDRHHGEAAPSASAVRVDDVLIIHSPTDHIQLGNGPPLPRTMMESHRTLGNPRQSIASNVSAAHEVPEPTEGRRRDFRALHERYPFTSRAASGAERRAA